MLWRKREREFWFEVTKIGFRLTSAPTYNRAVGHKDLASKLKCHATDGNLLMLLEYYLKERTI